MSKLPAQEKAEKPGKGASKAGEAEEGMTLWEHLEELRSRIIKMALTFMVGFVIAWFYKELVLEILTQPFVRAWHLKGRAQIGFPAPASLFLAYVRLSALAGFVFALPIMLYQVWAFIAPGLYSREKRYAIPFVVSSCALFAGGSYFGYKVAFPLAFEFLLKLAGPVGGLDVTPTVMIENYLDFVMRMLLVFGAAAELPVLVFFLSVAGLVNHRHLIKFFRYFLVIDFIIAAVITPPDVMSQLLFAIPLALLYIFSIGISWIFARKPPPPDTAEETAA
jgi:sec-independent protein translocase protein TatC